MFAKEEICSKLKKTKEYSTYLKRKRHRSEFIIISILAVLLGWRAFTPVDTIINPIWCSIIMFLMVMVAIFLTEFVTTLMDPHTCTTGIVISVIKEQSEHFYTVKPDDGISNIRAQRITGYTDVIEEGSSVYLYKTGNSQWYLVPYSESTITSM